MYIYIHICYQERNKKEYGFCYMSRLISYCILLLVKFYINGCNLNVLVEIAGIFLQNGR